MKPLSPDTPLEVERVWLAMQRERGPEWRLHRMAELTEHCWREAREAMSSAHPDKTQKERDLMLTTLRYGEELARKVVEKREQMGFYG